MDLQLRQRRGAFCDTTSKSNAVSWPGLAHRAHQIGLYEITEPSLPTSFTCTKRPRSSYQMSCE